MKALVPQSLDSSKFGLFRFWFLRLVILLNEMSSYRTTNVDQRTTSNVASSRSTENTTHSSSELQGCSEAPLSFITQFYRNWPLLKRGFSFPVHDDISHESQQPFRTPHKNMKPQSGSIDVPKGDTSFFDHSSPPIYLIGYYFLFALFAFFSSTFTDFFVFEILIVLLAQPCFYLVLSLYLACLYAIGLTIYRIPAYIRFKRNCYKWRPVMNEQMGMRLPAFFTPDVIARETTLLLALNQSIQSSSDKRGVIAAIVSYAQAHSQTSLLGHLYSLFSTTVPEDLNSLFTDHVNGMIEQSGESEEKWLEDIKSALTDWKL